MRLCAYLDTNNFKLDTFCRSYHISPASRLHQSTIVHHNHSDLATCTNMQAWGEQSFMITSLHTKKQEQEKDIIAMPPSNTKGVQTRERCLQWNMHVLFTHCMWRLYTVHQLCLSNTSILHCPYILHAGTYVLHSVPIHHCLQCCICMQLNR